MNSDSTLQDQAAASPSLASLTAALLAFRDARDWKPFHTLKNLLVSLALEAAELLELTQWKGDAELDARLADAEFRRRLEEECADVFLYLLMVAEKGGFDIARVAAAKIALNETRYPVEKSRGNALKYTAF